VFALIFYATPLFWIALMAILLFSVTTDWLPSFGYETIGANYTGFHHVLDVGAHLIMPATTIGLFFMATYTRMTRASMLEVRRLDFVKTARAKGLSDGVIQRRQRAMIAMALEPAVLVADEPTTALDVATQAQILKLIRNLQRSHNMAVMFTHDFGVVADIADQVVVLRHGKVVEEGAAHEIFTRPRTTTPKRCSRPCPPSIRRRANRLTNGPRRLRWSGSTKPMSLRGAGFAPIARSRRQLGSASRSSRARLSGSSASRVRANPRWRGW